MKLFNKPLLNLSNVKIDDLIAKVNANKTYQEKVRFMTLGCIKVWFRLYGHSDRIKLEPRTIANVLHLMGSWDE